MMILALVVAITGAFSAVGAVQRVMLVKQPTTWFQRACADQGWFKTTDPVSQRQM